MASAAAVLNVVLAHRDHTLRAESAAALRSLGVESRLEHQLGGGEELGWSSKRMCRVAASFRPLEPFRPKSAKSIPPKPPRELTLRPPIGLLPSSKLMIQAAFYAKGALYGLLPSERCREVPLFKGITVANRGVWRFGSCATVM